MKTISLKTFLMVAVAAIFIFASCGDSDVVAPLPAPTPTPKLVFTGNISNGGTIDAELTDTVLNDRTDGNASSLSSTMAINLNNPNLPAGFEALSDFTLTLTLTNLNYWGENIEEIKCETTAGEKLPLVVLKLTNDGSYAQYFQQRDVNLYYIDVPTSMLVEQGANDKIKEFDIDKTDPTFKFVMNCTGSDSSSYTLTIYPASNVLSHGIITKFSAETEEITGIMMVHRVDDGYPDCEILM